MSEILSSKRVLKTPSAIKHLFSETHLNLIEKQFQPDERFFESLIIDNKLKEKVLDFLYAV